MDRNSNAITRDRKKSGRRTLLISALILAVLIIAARVSSYICTLSSTNIAYPAWVESFTSYLSEILGALRLSVSFTLICCAVYSGVGSAPAVLISALFSALNYLACFAIDLSTNAIADRELVALIWLGINFIYEFVFIMLSYLAAKIMKLKLSTTDDSRKKKKFTLERACLLSVLMYMISRIISELYYLIDFLLSYVNITNTEIASIVGAFVKIIVIYGCIPCLFSYFCIYLIGNSRTEGNISDEI